MSHISKRLSDAQATTILKQYQEKTLSARDAQAKLGLKRSRFFDFVREFKKDTTSFGIARKSDVRKSRVGEEAEERIKELCL